MKRRLISTLCLNAFLFTGFAVEASAISEDKLVMTEKKEDKKSTEEKKEDKETTEEDNKEKEKDKDKEKEEDKDKEKEEDKDKEKDKDDKEDELGDDLFSFKIKVEDKVFTLPFPWKDMEEEGWKFKSNLEGQKLAPNYYFFGVEVKNLEKNLTLSIINLTSNDSIEAEDTHVYKISWYAPISKTDNKKKITSWELPAGITQESSLEDIKKAYGDPTEERDSKDKEFTYLTYKKDSEKLVKFTFNNKKKSIYEMNITNLEKVEDKGGNTSGQVSNEVPEEIKNYEQPKKVSDDIYDYDVNLDDVVYRIPAPVSLFLENGWELETDVKTIKSLWEVNRDVYLVKDNNKLKITLKNYSSKEELVENTWVTSIKVAPEVDFKGVKYGIANDIEIGMSEKELKSALKDINYDFMENKYTNNYMIKDGGYSTITISVNNETGEVKQIDIYRNPKELPY